MVAHFICVLFTGFLIYTARPGSSLFSWHPTLMSLAFGFLMAQAILIFSPHSSLYPSAARKLKVKIHWILNSLATVCSVLGAAAIFYNKTLSNKDHFTSWHGLIGIITVGYVIVQSFAGIFNLNPHWVKFIRLADLKIYHATSGTLLTLLVTASLVLGMNSKWFTDHVTGTSWYACAACPILIAMMISNQVSQEYVGRKVAKPQSAAGQNAAKTTKEAAAK